jgi:hypothetical protein
MVRRGDDFDDTGLLEEPFGEVADELGVGAFVS